MGREFSIYLDLVRFTAALLVLFHHMADKTITLVDAPFAGYGHSAVLVFFVLSGYVIAYVTDTREKELRSYTVNRCGRIYSVAIPALLLTPLLDYFGAAWMPGIYEGHAPNDLWGIRVISSLLFTNELWFLSIMSFSNLPYWSLNYEVWYYILFAALQFLSGRTRIVAVTLILLIMGPKIAMLAPIWWLGVALYRDQRLKHISLTTGWILYILSIVLFALFVHYSVEENARNWLQEILGREKTHLLVSSKFFISHYMLAVIVGMHLVAARAVATNFSAVLIPLEPAIRWVASYTFALYLFHRPLLMFFAALYGADPALWSSYYSILFSVLAAVVLIGQFTEKKKNAFRSVFEVIYDRLALLLRRAEISPRI
jgi:peptidoglycan/LPS O-acetylase OafA/YrhL